MITCDRCGTQNNDSFNCCYNCGARLKKDNKPEFLNKKPENNTEEDSPEIDFLISDYNAESVKNDRKFKNDKFAPKKVKKNSGLSVKKVLFLLLMLFAAFVAVWGTIKVLDKLFPIDQPISSVVPGSTDKPGVTINPGKTAAPADNTPTPFTTPWVEGNYIPTSTVDGDNLYNITIQTNGEKIYALGREFDVVNNRVDFTATQYEIYTFCKPSGIVMGDKFDAVVQVIVSSEEFDSDYTYTLKIVNVTTPTVPVTLISPKTTVCTVYKTKTTIEFETVTNARIKINGQEFTDDYLNKETGIFSITIDTTIEPNPHYFFNVTVESPDYVAKSFDLDITRSADHDPEGPVILELDGDSTVYTADATTGIVTLTGRYTGPKEKIIFNGRNNAKLELVSIDFDADGYGYFTAVLKTKMIGWTEVTIECATNLDVTKRILIKDLSTANLTEAQQTSGKTPISVFTSSAQNLKSYYSSLSNQPYSAGGSKLVIGYSSADKAVVQEIVDDEFGKAAWVLISINDTTDGLVYVEFGQAEVNIAVGNSVKIFGNSMTSKDGKPRIAAVYVSKK